MVMNMDKWQIIDNTMYNVSWPNVRAVKSEKEGFTIVEDCPYCHGKHRHGRLAITGDQRFADCGKGEYILKIDN